MKQEVVKDMIETSCKKSCLNRNFIKSDYELIALTVQSKKNTLNKLESTISDQV